MKSVTELTKVVIGRELSMPELADLVGLDEITRPPHPSTGIEDVLWVGSIGYERYRDVADFARCLANAGVERLIDVRDLPISRRRGYAKSALRTALADFDVEYIHIRPLGNPKPLRDLYKAGHVAEGRRRYARLLRHERWQAVTALPSLLTEKRSALMCFEHDENFCHRQVIFDALRDHLGIELQVEQLGKR